MPFSSSLLAIAERVGGNMAAQRRGRFHSSIEFFEEGASEPDSSTVTDGSFDLEAECFALSEESHHGRRSNTLERRVFVAQELVYERRGSRVSVPENALDGQADEELAQVLSELAEGLSQDEERWLSKPLTAAYLAEIRARFVNMEASASGFIDFLDSPDLEGSTEPAAPGRLVLRLAGPLSRFPAVADGDLARSNPDLEISMRLTLDLEREVLESVRLEMPMPAQFGGQVVTTYSFYGYGRPVSIERPGPDECLPDLPPLAGHVERITDQVVTHILRLRFERCADGSPSALAGREALAEISDVDPTRPTERALGYARRAPVPGEHLLVSGRWHCPELDFAPWSDEVPSEDRCLFSPDCLLAADGYLYDLMDGAPPSDLVERDEHGLLDAPVMAQAGVLSLRTDVIYELELVSDDGRHFCETLTESEWSRPERGEPVTIARAWSMGQEEIAYVERPDGSLLFGARPQTD
jgi:hypothetical protein